MLTIIILSLGISIGKSEGYKIQWLLWEVCRNPLLWHIILIGHVYYE
jgi:hypothetical protein